MPTTPHEQPGAATESSVSRLPLGVKTAESGAVVVVQERMGQEQRHGRTYPIFLLTLVS